ncbi:MAG: hypothetical protein ACXWJ6_04950 [Xanthobacteraceae bacterium]
MELVPNRECGECTVCCRVLLIDDPDFQKLPGVTCPNCKAGAGCQIYAMRPAACRGFYCAWRYMPELGEQLRPDRSGIMVRFIREHIPPGLKPVGLNFLLFDRKDVLGPGLADYFARLVADNTAVFLSIRGPAGLSDGAVLLNSHLAPAIGDTNKVLAVLHDALSALAKNIFAPALFRYGKSALSD